MTYKHVQSTIFEPLLDAFNPNSSEFDALIQHACLSDPESEGNLEPPALRVGVSKRLFDIGSREDTRDANRRRMYKLWRAYDENDDADEVAS